MLLFSILSPATHHTASAEDWLARLQDELPAADEFQFRSAPNICCRVTTRNKGNDSEKVIVDQIAVKDGNRCFVRSQDASTEKQVMVFTPVYCFRLHSDPSGSQFVINRITEAKDNPEYQTKTLFPFELAIDDMLFANAYIKDLKVSELLHLGTVRHIETLTDQALGELPTYEFDLTADPSNFQTVTVTLIPSRHWALKRWTVKFKDRGGGRSTETREIDYLDKEDGEVFPAAIHTTSIGQPLGGAEFRIESSSKVSDVELNAVDEAVFTLPHYGLPDLFAPKDARSRWLNPWLWGALIIGLGLAWWLYKSRDRSPSSR